MVTEGYQQDVLSKRSKVTTERLALLVVSGLLAAAVIGLCVTVFDNIRLKQMFKKQDDLQNRNESGNTNVSEREPCSTVKPTCPVCPTVEKRKPCRTVQPTCPKTDVKDQACYKCEEGWEQHGGKCYYFSISKSSWEQSRDECRAKGGELVKIDSREEQTFLVRRLRVVMTEAEDKFWIGLTDSAVEGRCLWVDGSQLNQSLTFWRVKEPDNWNGTHGEHPDGEDCVRMGEKSEGGSLEWWFDAFCSKPHRSICKKAGVRGKFKKVCD
ncbi:C-type lectin domain family 4 member C-like [Pundamilia nyererei]|uniref:C-type lectin domain family 4 member C-like n=1 Tax=Pundamilia nyererei TaxID=303518 RepID=A0A9Y6M809_9CICH|nr:PREDICTED: C-type lectin domain family 4 member C-like [Pundamilia nyererei]